MILGWLVSLSVHAATLDEAWQAAESTSVEVGLAREQALQTGLQRGRAWSAFSPRVVGQATYLVNQYEAILDPSSFAPDLPFDFGDPTVIQAKTSWSADVTVSQSLFSAATVPGLMGAYALHRSALAQEERTLQQLRLAVAQAYYGVLSAREAEELSQLAVQTASRQLQLAQRQVEVGLTDRRALLQAQLAVASAQRDEDAAVTRRTEVELSLSRLTGWEPQTPLETPQVVESPSSVSEAVRQARMDRPDVRGDEAYVRAAKLRSRAQTLTWLPNIDGAFTYSWTEVPGFQPEPTAWRVAVVGTWSFWDGGTRVANQRQYDSERRVGELRLRQRIEQVEDEVQVAWLEVMKAGRSLESVEAQVALANENLALAEASFKAGQATMLDIEVARLTQQQATLALVQDRASVALSRLRLRLAMGDL